MVGVRKLIGILWKEGYYDQARNTYQTLKLVWIERFTIFLKIPGYVSKSRFMITLFGSESGI
jgi:hypothetical protein